MKEPKKLNGQMVRIKYGEYLDLIEKLAAYSLIACPTVEKLIDNKSRAQTIYNDMKAFGFNGKLISFLCLIASLQLIEDLRRFPGNKKTLLDWIFQIIEAYETHRMEVRSLLRLYNVQPFFFSQLKRYIDTQEWSSDEDESEEWGTTDNLKDVLRHTAVLACFLELVMDEDFTQAKRKDSEELKDFIKAMVSAKDQPVHPEATDLYTKAEHPFEPI